MKLALVLALALAFVAPIGAAPSTSPLPIASKPAEELAPVKARRALRVLVDNLAKLGLATEVESIRQLLIELGDTPADHEKLAPKWGKALGKAKPGKDKRAWESLGKKFAKQVKPLERALATLEGEPKEKLARLILKLDSRSSSAHLALAHELVDGAWQSPESMKWREDATRVSELTRKARALKFDIIHGGAKMATAITLYGTAANRVSCKGISIEGQISPSRLERILRESLRAAALSNALLGGRLEMPKLKSKVAFVFTSSETEYQSALDDAITKGGVSESWGKEIRSIDMESFLDARGWRTSRRRTEADFQALIVWDTVQDWMGWGSQPCFVAGHLNWICLNFFGTTQPISNWKDDAAGERSVSADAKRMDALWRSAAGSLFGCRAWMRARLLDGEVFPYTRAIVDKLGKITQANLLKATLMNEYLQGRGELRHLVDKTLGAKDRLAAIEAALGRSIPELEAEWRAWLFNQVVAPGLVQRLGVDAKPNAKAETPEILAVLREVRERAFRELPLKVDPLTMDPELSAQAALHAHYLVLNPEQGERWPDAHEEYSDREGFSAAGAWAGLHSVIHFTPDAKEAIDGWMATFYHRLPLMNPGLFGIGYGNDGDVTVLDTSSLVADYQNNAWVVWPAQGAKSTPRSFQPELPNPVPGEDQSRWGYPITLQVFDVAATEGNTIRMQLFQGTGDTGKEIACHFLTPTEPAFEDLAPKNAWCLIPLRTLGAQTTYTVVAVRQESGEKKMWSFKTGR